jgi:hypothetical protein
MGTHPRDHLAKGVGLSGPLGPERRAYRPWEAGHETHNWFGEGRRSPEAQDGPSNARS